MYTPNDIFQTELIKNDRPYAGWLYTGIGFHRKTEKLLDIFEVTVGLIGPQSYAREAQDTIHDLRDFDKARGWDNQLKNEPGLNFSIERKQRVFDRDYSRLGFDVITHYGVSLGNVFTAANMGLEFRAGWNIPQDFGEALLGRSGNSNSPGLNENSRWHGNLWSLYAFTAIDGRAVARNIFLDGNTFANSHSVDKEHWVGDWATGVSAIINGRYKIAYSQVIRTREYQGQNDGQIFGATSLTILF